MSFAVRDVMVHTRVEKDKAKASEQNVGSCRNRSSRARQGSPSWVLSRERRINVISEAHFQILSIAVPLRTGHFPSPRERTKGDKLSE